mmetsp:Transcript_20760/g.54441  ORF Transcript_20760/g.54441 Transcript_20760/m.54441 type:complete len:245 (-) Transcript_20760:123-857(-)
MDAGVRAMYVPLASLSFFHAQLLQYLTSPLVAYSTSRASGKAHLASKSRPPGLNSSNASNRPGNPCRYSSSAVTARSENSHAPFVFMEYEGRHRAVPSPLVSHMRFMPRSSRTLSAHRAMRDPNTIFTTLGRRPTCLHTSASSCHASDSCWRCTTWRMPSCRPRCSSRDRPRSKLAWRSAAPPSLCTTWPVCPNTSLWRSMHTTADPIGNRAARLAGPRQGGASSARTRWSSRNSLAGLKTYCV